MINGEHLVQVYSIESVLREEQISSLEDLIKQVLSQVWNTSDSKGCWGSLVIVSHLSTLQLVPAVWALQLLKSGTVSLQLSEYEPTLTLSFVTWIKPISSSPALKST